MTKIFRHIMRKMVWLPLLFAALALTACVYESEPTDPSEDSSPHTGYYVSIRFITGALSATRSVLPEEQGNDIENKISLSDLQILVFDENGVLKDFWYRDGFAIENTRLIEQGKGVYLISSKLDSDRYDQSSRFSIVVLANWKSLEESSPVGLVIGKTQYSDLAARTFLLNNGNPAQAWTPGDDSLIPMFGVLHTNLSGYSNSINSQANPKDLGTINELRSVAKIEVTVGLPTLPAGLSMALTSVELTQRNTRGFLTPEIIGDQQDTHQVTAANIPADTGYSDTPLPLRKNGNVYEAYVPEMALANNIEGRKSIDVKLSVSYQGLTQEVSHKIAFAPYSDGLPYLPDIVPDEWKSLLRNHIYRYQINVINTLVDVEFDVIASCDRVINVPSFD